MPVFDYTLAFCLREKGRGEFLLELEFTINLCYFRVFPSKPALCFIFRRQTVGFFVANFVSGYNEIRIGSEKRLKMKQSVTHFVEAMLLTGLLSLSLLLGACGETATPATTATMAVTTSAAAATTTTAAMTSAATTTAAMISAATTTAAITTAATTTAVMTSATTTAVMTTAPPTTAATTTVAMTSSTAMASGTAATTTVAGSVTNTTYPLTLTDDNKRTLTLPKAPTKIVSLAPSNTEILFALGLNDKIVGVDQFSDYPEAAKAIKKIGGFSDTNIEAVTALAPDLILASSIQSKAQIAALEKQNFMVLILNPSDLAGVVKDFKLVGQATNTNDKAQTLSDNFQKRLDAVTTKIKSASAKPSVYFELDPTLYTVGPGSFVDDIIQKAGGQNIVTDASNPYPQLTQEVIVGKSPQVIFVGDDTSGTDTPDKIMARPGWNTIAAVKNKRVYAINADLTNRPGPRAVDGVEQVAKFLYPDLFK